jgi:hypothetical protein
MSDSDKLTVSDRAGLAPTTTDLDVARDFWTSAEESDCYDPKGRRISTKQWAEMMRDPAIKRVCGDMVDGLAVSTVWLGMNHAFGSGRPLIFETMIFDHTDGSKRPWADLWMTRYSTMDEAIAGHRYVVAALKQRLLAKDTDERLLPGIGPRFELPEDVG